MKAFAGVFCVVVVLSALASGCGKKTDDAEASGAAAKSGTAVTVPATVPPEAKAQIQQGIQHGQADGAAYAAQQKAHAAQQGSK